MIQEKKLFEPIHRIVKISQKVLEYRPTDKRVFVTLGIMAATETVFDLNTVRSPHQPLLAAFGYETCADLSVIQQTLAAATQANVQPLEQAQKEIWQSNNQILLLMSNPQTEAPLTIDLDLSPLPASKAAEKSKKGDVAKKKNQYSRQLARVLVPKTSEIVTQSLYSGNTVSCSVFKEMIAKMEDTLQLETQEKRKQIYADLMRVLERMKTLTLRCGVAIICW